MDLKNQIELEQLFNKNQLMKRLRYEFLVPEITSRCELFEIDMAFAIDLLAQMVIHKRAGIGMLVGILHRHFGEETKDLQACANMILKAAEVDLVDWQDLAQQIVIKIDVTPDVYADLERYQYPLPMVVQPKRVNCNEDTGYYTSKGSIILKGNHHEDDVCLDHINRANQVRLVINPDTARMVKNQWRHLDKPKDGEDYAEYKKRVDAFEKYDRISRDVMESLFMTNEDGFYLTHKYDKRGRCYAQGYHINPQGNAWNKAVVEFAEKELVK